MTLTQTMNLTDFKHIRFLGAEGIGMRALIAILEDKISQGELNSDFKISKSDLSYKTNDPLDESIDLVVRSTAVRADDPDMLFMQKHNIPVIHRSEMLNLLSEDAKQIVISGTHGKTSTSALTTHLLTKLGLEPGFAVGGVLKDYKANGKAAPKSSALNDGPSGYFVMEGDESDKSFMRTTPYIAVVTDVEADHLENYPGGLAEIQACFKDFLDRAEYKIVCINNPFLKAYAENILKERPDLTGRILSYSSTDESADLFINLENSSLHFQSLDSGHLDLAISGKFNLLNACASLLVAHILGFKTTEAKALFKDFHGTQRRMELINSNEMEIYDDYAHHPSEIKALLDSVKAMLKTSTDKALFIYQPHHPERTQQFWGDFVKVFKEFPENIDVLLLDIYVARSQHIEGVNSKKMAKEIALNNVKYLDPNENLSASEAKEADVQGNFKDIAMTLKPLIDKRIQTLEYKKIFFVGAGNISKIAEKYRA
ncbi:MAG: UDP-N-acetylmuramate--L-alanine ligase [Vampirovibrionia bacterium]